MAMDANALYWNDRFSRAVQRAARDGSDLRTIALGTDPVAVAVDASCVYWAVQRPPYGPGGAILVAPVTATGGAVGIAIATSPDAL